MSRRRKTIKRGITPDPKYNSELVAKVIRSLMRSGKKTTSERIVYGFMLPMAVSRTWIGSSPVFSPSSAMAP